MFYFLFKIVTEISLQKVISAVYEIQTIALMYIIMYYPYQFSGCFHIEIEVNSRLGHCYILYKLDAGAVPNIGLVVDGYNSVSCFNTYFKKPIKERKENINPKTLN